jgi:hypothetical protein
MSVKYELTSLRWGHTQTCVGGVGVGRVKGGGGADTVTEPPREGVCRQDQLERFLVKREHNQHT